MLDDFGVGQVWSQGKKFCMELGGPAALEVRDRYGEAMVMLGRVALWLGRDSEKTRFAKMMRVD